MVWADDEWNNNTNEGSTTETPAKANLIKRAQWKEKARTVIKFLEVV